MVLNARRFVAADRLVRPVPPGCLEIDPKRFGCVGCSRRRRGERRSSRDPLSQDGDLGFGHLLLGRHLHRVVFIADGLDEQALVRLARHHGRPGVSPLLHPFRRVENKAPLDVLGLT